MPRKYHFTEEMKAATWHALQSKKGALPALARTDPRFQGIPVAVLHREARRMGYIHTSQARGPHPTKQSWSEEESEFASAAYLRGVSIDNISQAMRRRGWPRSASAIQSHLKFLGIRREHGDYITPKQLAYLVGVSDTTVGRWIRRHGLAIHHTTGKWQHISLRTLRRWILDHPDLFSQNARPDLVWLISVLCPTTIGDTADHENADDDSGDWLNGEAVRDVAAAD